MWCPWLPWRALFFIVAIRKGTSGSVIMKGGKCETAGRAGAGVGAVDSNWSSELNNGTFLKIIPNLWFFEIYFSDKVESINYSKQMLVKAGNTSMIYTRSWTGNTLLNINKYVG